MISSKQSGFKERQTKLLKIINRNMRSLRSLGIVLNLGWRDRCTDAYNFVKLDFLYYFPFKIHTALACVGFDIDVHLDCKISHQSENFSLKPVTISPTSLNNDLLTKAVNHLTEKC
jgi:hypothetical protein